MTQPSHSFPVRVYYEDTDLGQVVYYANYLRFIERARSEWLRDCGVDQQALLADPGVAFVVRRVEADYLRPARFDDLLDVRTRVRLAQGSRIELSQAVHRAGTELFRAEVRLVCVDLAAMRPARLPAAVLAAIGVTAGGDVSDGADGGADVGAGDTATDAAAVGGGAA